MNKAILIIIVILVAVGGYFLLRGGYQTPAPSPTQTSDEVQKTAEPTEPESTPTEPESTPTTAGEVKEFDITAKRWNFSPSAITVNNGDTVKLHIRSIDVTHGFGLSGFGISERLEPGKTVDIEFVADKTGTFTFACIVVCGSGHSGMKGQLIVK